MKILKKLHNYIQDNDSVINIWNKKIYLKNYSKINIMTTKIIEISYLNFKIKINGTTLCIKKILDNEIMIHGYISNIEFIYE